MKRIFTPFLLLALLCGVADAQLQIAPGIKLPPTTGVFPDTSFTDAEDGNGAWRELPANTGSVTCYGEVTPVSGTTPTFDAYIQHCTDKENAKTCSTLCSFTQCTTSACWTDGSEEITPDKTNLNPKKFVRLVTTLGGTTPIYNVATFEVRVTGR